MALDFICSKPIMRGGKISIPGGANCYRTKSGNINFYKFNPTLGEANEIPKNSKEICFENYEIFSKWKFYGNPVFYDGEGKIIN